METINKNSEYYRVCQNCNKEFMADDLREKYCGNKCRDQNNNRKKRFRKASEPIKYPGMPPDSYPTEQLMINLKNNIRVFTTYRIGEDGIIVPIQELYNKGIVFRAFTSRFPASAGSDGYWIEYGPYILSRETEDDLLIRIKTV